MSSKLSPLYQVSSLFDAVDEMMITLDLNLRIQWANQKTGDLVGEDPQDLVGQYCFRVWHGRETPCEECPTRVTMQTEEPRESEVTVSDGRCFHFKIYPLRSDKGTVENVAQIGLDISQTKQAEAELQKNKQFLDLVTDNMFDLVSVADMQGNIEYAGKSHEILGYDLDFFIGKNVLDFVHQEDKNYVKKELNHFLLNENQEFEVEYRCICRDNSCLWFETRGRPIEDKDENAAKILFSTRNITERKQAEQERAQEAETQQILLDNIRTLVWYMIDDRTYGSVNKAFAEFQGLAPKDMAYKDLCDLYPEDVAEICRQTNSEVFATGKSVSTETWVPHVSGEWRLLSILRAPKLRSDGTVDYVVCSADDVTERKQTEEALRRSESYYRTLFETSGSIMFILEEDKTISRVNSNFEKLTGYSRQEIEGKKCATDFVHPEDASRLERNHHLRRRDPRAAPRNDETRFFNRDNELLYGYLTIDLIPGTSQSVVSLLDITEYKQFEKTLLESEQQFRTLFIESPAAMYIHDKDTGEVLDANPQALASNKLSSIQDLNVNKIWLESPYSYIEAVGWVRKAAHEGPQQFVWLNFTPYGEYVWEQIRLIPMTINGVERVVAATIDITELKQTEEALRKQEEHLHTILQAAPDPIVVYDRSGQPEYINPAFSQLFGWDFEELQGGCVSFVPEDQKENTYYRIREVYNTGVPVTFDTKSFTKQNHLLDIRVSAAVIQRSLEEHYGLVMILTDITGRKQMEEQLRAKSFQDFLTGLYNRNFFEEEMNRLSNGRYAQVGLIVCDLDGLKLTNDTLGHRVGDQMLMNTADILRQNFRYSDIIARIGGDEFAILLEGIDWDTMEQMQQRLRKAVQDYNSTETEVPLSLSIGHAVGEGGTTDMHALFREADNRMYREKIQREGSVRSAILRALTGSMEARDFKTENHCGRLQEMADALARSQDLSRDFRNDLSLLARFHDLGKVGIPDHILFKPVELTQEEWRQMRQHCEIGHRIASSVPDLKPIAEYILKHHERWDGRGYPLGVSGRDIPLPCRILAIVDAYDAMISDRPYRKSVPREEAIAELMRNAGTQFDPELVEQFIQIVHKHDLF